MASARSRSHMRLPSKSTAKIPVRPSSNTCRSAGLITIGTSVSIGPSV